MDAGAIDFEKITVGALAIVFALGLLKVIDRHLIRQDASLPGVAAELIKATNAITGLTTQVQLLASQISEMRDDFTPRSRPVPVPRGRYGPTRTSTPATGTSTGKRAPVGDDDER